MSDCLFCGIADGTVPSNQVHSDEMVVAFTDINPQAPVHILIIPREHIDSFAALNHSHSEIWSWMTGVTRKIAKEHNLAADGYRVVTNIGTNGGQTVGHLHLHLLGGRRMEWPPG